MKNETNKIKKSNRKKITIITLTILVTLLLMVSIGGGTYLFDTAIVTKPPLSAEVDPNADPETQIFAKARHDGQIWMDEMQAETLQQTATDGTELTGYYIPASKPSTKTVILVHGHRSDARMMGDYGKIYYEQGFNIFMADNRGHGSSDGDYVGMGWLDRIDYLGWLNILMEKTGQDTEFVLHGISMGAATVLMLSGENNIPTGVKAIIADCSFTSAWDELQYQITNTTPMPSFPIMNIGDLESQIFAGYSFKDASAVNQVKKTNIPIFIIHGDADTYNPTWMAQIIYDAIPGSEKELWLVPGADHGVSFYMERETYIHKIETFYKKYLSL